MLTNREKVNFKIWDVFSGFLYTFTINCVTTCARKCLLNICFALFEANNGYKSFHRAKSSLFSSVFRKVIPDNTIPTFQEVGG